MNPPPTSIVYIVGADPALHHALRGLLESVGLRTLACVDVAAFVAAYQPDWPGCLLLDARASGPDDPGALRRLREEGIDAPVIVLAEHASVAMVVTALRRGVLDFIEKPFNEQILLDGVHHALAVGAARRRARAQHQELLRRFDTLTAREQDVLRWVVAGLPNREIAETLNLSRKTVEIHRARVMRKMEAETLSQLIQMTVAIGILELYDSDG
ncbi:MAG: LuxR C-terminal-related transcriptional regulator [Candidatus Contendobacter sp.]|nr:LuxR C-terminal-related transcriptional regulator [Candidatus Contendobacter sp.]MDG4556508.1 LuxR C-terminal-related transcriptional regulator [Candidatus Contendobacter sp.]